MMILNKKFKVLLFIFLILLCISTANAESDYANSDIQSADIMEVKSDKDIAIIDEETFGKTGNFSTLNNIINDGGNNQIQLQMNYTYNEDNDNSFKNGINITKNVSIDGNGYTIDGNHSTRIFYITKGASLTLKNIILINGNGIGYGGAIYNSGSLTLINVTLSNNNVFNNSDDKNYYAYGGAVYSSGNITVVNSTFNNNNVIGNFSNNYTTNIYVGGGAIYSETNIDIINSRFYNNSVTSNNKIDHMNIYACGGAVYGAKNITVINSTFSNNKIIKNRNSSSSTYSGNNYGGAIYCGENITINDSKFIKNNVISNSKDYNSSSNYHYSFSFAYGGAIYVDKNIFVINSIFSSNSAISNSDSPEYSSSNSYGGAIYVGYNSENATILNSTFSNNTAITNSNSSKQASSDSYGGAIYVDTKITVINSIFSNNSAISNSDSPKYSSSNSYGGAIYVNFNSENATILNSTFLNNHAITNSNLNATAPNNEINSVSYGGAIYNYEGNMSIINSIFSNNSAISNSKNNCKDVDNNNTYNYNYNYNNVNSHGGAIYAIYNNNITIINSTFSYNSAISNITGNNNLIDNKDNYKLNIKSYGGAIYIYSSSNDNGNITIIESTFSNNSAINNININTTKTGNTNIDSSTGGGSIYIYAFSYDNGNITIIESTFSNNSAISNININTTENANTYTNSENYGGAIYAGKNINLINSKFLNNIVNSNDIFFNKGGAIYVFLSNLYLNNSTFINNTGTFGGSVYCDSSNVIINESKFRGNYATYGGALYYGNSEFSTSSDVCLTVTNSTFMNNNGTFGDDIYTSHNTIVKNNTYTENSYANIYANNTIVNYSIISVLNNKTYFVAFDNLFSLNATAFADGASIDGYYILLTDGRNTYDTTYKGYGVYESIYNITDTFVVRSYTAIINNYSEKTDYTIEDGTIIKIKEINLEVENLTKYYGDNKKLTIKLTDAKGNPIANQNVSITINGKTYIRTTNENGTILMSINIIPGVYETEVSYENITQEINITILSTIESEDLIKYFKNGSQYYAKFLDVDGTALANTEVTFNIHGVFYTRTTDNNGIAKLSINLNPGEYIITAYNPINNEAKANIITVLTTIFGENVVKYYRNGTQYYAYVFDLDGTPLANAKVTFNIHGVFYNKNTDENGLVKLNINLNPGEYIITAWNLANGESKSNNISIYSVVKSQDLEMSTQSRKPFKVTILGEQGKPLANAKVTFNINGVFYTRTTDANGEVSLNINLVAGKYIITTYYNEYAVSNTIVVK